MQELNRHLVTQKAEAERLLTAREADAAQLQQELTAMQQVEHSVPSMHAMHGRQNALQVDEWQMSISEAAANRYEKHDSDPTVKELLEDNRKLQVRLLHLSEPNPHPNSCLTSKVKQDSMAM